MLVEEYNLKVKQHVLNVNTREGEDMEKRKANGMKREVGVIRLE